MINELIHALKDNATTYSAVENHDDPSKYGVKMVPLADAIEAIKKASPKITIRKAAREIKDHLVELAVNDDLPIDMNGFDIEPVIEIIKKHLLK